MVGSVNSHLVKKICEYSIAGEKEFSGYCSLTTLKVYLAVYPLTPVLTLPQVTLWDTGGLERFRSMTRSYFHHLSALVLVHSTNKDSSLEHLGGWINQATDETSPPILCVWTNVVDASDTDEQRVAERVPHFISHYNIDARLCFNICAVSGKVESERQSAIVDACNTLLDRLIQNSLVGSASYSSGSVEPTTGSFSTTLVSEPVRNEAMSLQLDYDAVDGEKTQSPRHCWGKC